MNFLEVSKLSRKEQESYVVKDICFTQPFLKKVAIAGATGSGKTSLLKMIAGLVQPTEGIILFNGEKVKGPEEQLLPGHPGIVYLSQHFELRNHYRVEEILAMANTFTDGEATAIYEICRITHLLKRWTHQVSGGEKQRIALARLLVTAPRLLLLDEPYSNLDVIHKTTLKKVISDVCENLSITCILISHDPQDTLSWADEIIVLEDGRLIQHGQPEEIYKHPVNEYAAALFGKYTLLTPSLARAFGAVADTNTKVVNRFIRPEHFKLKKQGEGLMCKVLKGTFMGSYYEAVVVSSGLKLIINTGTQRVSKGDIAYVSLCMDN
jgi:ABC-type Fe3+/spermidine/putrescine transport system ATPase subunit